jgi:hypothetical protein
MTLTSADCRRFQEQGIVFPLRVLSTAEADYYRQECDALETRLGGRPRTIDVRQMHLHFRWAHALATLPSVLDSVEDLLGPNLLVTATELFAKHPQESTVSARGGSSCGEELEYVSRASFGAEREPLASCR